MDSKGTLKKYYKSNIKHIFTVFLVFISPQIRPSKYKEIGTNYLSMAKYSVSVRTL